MLLAVAAEANVANLFSASEDQTFLCAVALSVDNVTCLRD